MHMGVCTQTFMHIHHTYPHKPSKHYCRSVTVTHYISFGWCILIGIHIHWFRFSWLVDLLSFWVSVLPLVSIGDLQSTLSHAPCWCEAFSFDLFIFILFVPLCLEYYLFQTLNSWFLLGSESCLTTSLLKGTVNLSSYSLICCIQSVICSFFSNMFNLFLKKSLCSSFPLCFCIKWIFSVFHFIVSWAFFLYLFYTFYYLM